MKKFAFIYVLLLFACVVPAFSCWVYLQPDKLVEWSDLVVEATVKLPEGITVCTSNNRIGLKLQGQEDAIYPVTFVVNEIIKNNGILAENQTEITIGTERELWTFYMFDYMLSEGEKAVFFFTKTDAGLRLMDYPTYKLSKDESGLYKDESGHFLGETLAITEQKLGD